MSKEYKLLSYPILSLCKCGCNEIVYNGNDWKVGHYIRTNEIRNKNVKAQSGKHHSEETKRKMSELRRGIPKSKEWKEKRSKLSRGKNNHNYGKHPSKETLIKISDALIGKNNPRWIDGRSFKPYCYKFNGKTKERIRKRDDYICQLCNKTQKENNEKLSVHHVHYDKENCYPDLITLCNKCNSKVNKNRNYWEEYFMNILERKGFLNWKLEEVISRADF